MDTSTPTSQVIHLGRAETAPNRSFTNPEHSRADAAVLNYMRWRLHYLLSQSGIGPEHPLVELDRPLDIPHRHRHMIELNA